MVARVARWGPIVAAVGCAWGCSSGKTPSIAGDASPRDSGSESATGEGGTSEGSTSDGAGSDDGPGSTETGAAGDDAGTPSAVLSSSTIDLGPIACGQSGSAMLTLDNAGSGDLAVSAQVLGGAFSLSPLTLTVSSGKSGSFTVSSSVPSTATAGSVLSGTLLLFTNDPAHASAMVSLRATPTGAAVMFAPDSGAASFPSTEPGFSTTPVTVSLVNEGNAPATVAIGPPSDSEFALSVSAASGQPTTLAPGDTVSTTIMFTPGASTTTASGSVPVTVTGATCGSSVSSIALSGAVGHGIVTRWPSTLDFGSAECGGAAPVFKYVVLANGGATNARITSAALTGAPGFSTDAKGLVIPARLSASFTVFPPPVPSGSNLDQVVATLTIFTDADPSAHAITLTEEPSGSNCAGEAGTTAPDSGP
ncbi:MAG: hypothetical protein ACRENE_28630 [Polyangiaceae bacterium]